jgi:hypothetical protein
MTKCKICGWSNKKANEYCGNCGSKLKGSKRIPISQLQRKKHHEIDENKRYMSAHSLGLSTVNTIKLRRKRKTKYSRSKTK